MFEAGRRDRRARGRSSPSAQGEACPPERSERSGARASLRVLAALWSAAVITEARFYSRLAAKGKGPGRRAGQRRRDQ
jgi:hypothetical protein